MVRSLDASGLRAGQWAVFPGGGGGVGIQGVQLAKAIGLRPVVIDTGESKKKLSLDMGAEEFVDFKESTDVAEAVKKITDGIGAHGVFVTGKTSSLNRTSVPEEVHIVCLRRAIETVSPFPIVERVLNSASSWSISECYRSSWRSGWRSCNVHWTSPGWRSCARYASELVHRKK
jgi:NADPH:quinone reductase-like Zn-dependent oxidoreductase